MDWTLLVGYALLALLGIVCVCLGAFIVDLIRRPKDVEFEPDDD